MSGGGVPYFRQENAHSCGAACLQMAYAAHGIVANQSEIWSAIQTVPLSFGATMQRMALHATVTKFAAMTISAADPWRIAYLASRNGCSTIVHLRTHPTATLGHFCLLVVESEQSALLLDPLHGSPRPISREQMLQSWRSSLDESDDGNLIQVLGRPEGSSRRCPRCATALSDDCKCWGCGCRFSLALNFVLECTASCPNRAWNYVYCPQCDASLSNLVENPFAANALFSSLGFQNNSQGER